MQERRRVLSEEKKDYSSEYLTFKALESGTFTFTGAISYSTDDGVTWNYLQAYTKSPTINSGSKIMWKATLYPNSRYGIGQFGSTGNFTVEGNIMSLLYGDNFANQTSLIGKVSAFMYLFYNCTGMTSAENLVLPATTLANNCYNLMFYYCTSLTTAPTLPATTLADGCYSLMFYYCTSLTTAPTLPATTLITRCYLQMFDSCISLTTAPELPATTLATNCYQYMFLSCTSLNYIKAMFTTTPGTSYTNNWVSGVARSGTFVKNSAATWDVTGSDGIPRGWTVQNA